MTVDFPLAPNLPEPVDDGAADHQRGIEMPDLQLQSTAGRLFDLSRLGVVSFVADTCPDRRQAADAL